MMDAKSQLHLYDKTITEALFLCAEMIGNEGEEDALLADFYGRLCGESAAFPMTDEAVIAALIPVIHAHLKLRRGFGNDPPQERAVTGSEADPEGMRQTDSLITEYYRERRAHFVPSPLRIRRLRHRITE